MPKRTLRIRRWIIRSAISGMCLATLTIVLMAVFMEDLRRQYYLGKLCSSDVAERRLGVAYLQQHADDAKVLNHAGRLMSEADDACFLWIAESLQEAGRWLGSAGGTSWPRYLVLKIEDANPGERKSIAVELARDLWVASRPSPTNSTIAGIEKLLTDEDAGVRMNALSAAACLDPPARTRLLSLATHDQNIRIAARAWIILGFASKESLTSTELGDDAPPEIRAAFEYATTWRSPQPHAMPTDDADPWVKRLAELEALPPAGLNHVPIDADMPLLLRLFAVRASQSATPEDLLPAMRYAHPAVRDLACIIAMERFSIPRNLELTKQMLTSFDNTERMAGCVLAKLTPTAFQDVEVTRLVQLRARQPDAWELQQHARLDAALAANLLVHQSFPKTTLVTVTLGDVRHATGPCLTWLLNPLGRPGVGGTEQLRTLLVHFRFDHVLRFYLPDLPPLDYWADAETQRMQVDAMRDWFLIFRDQLSPVRRNAHDILVLPGHEGDRS